MKVISSLPGPSTTKSVALYWSPKAWRPTTMGFFQPGTLQGEVRWRVCAGGGGRTGAGCVAAAAAVAAPAPALTSVGLARSRSSTAQPACAHRRGMLSMTMGSRNTVPLRMLRIVPLGLFHICSAHAVRRRRGTREGRVSVAPKARGRREGSIADGAVGAVPHLRVQQVAAERAYKENREVTRSLNSLHHLLLWHCLPCHAAHPCPADHMAPPCIGHWPRALA